MRNTMAMGMDAVGFNIKDGYLGACKRKREVHGPRKTMVDA